MTDHLPECHLNLNGLPVKFHAPLAVDLFRKYAYLCICNRLRACEERVSRTDWAIDNAYWTGQTEGYAAALDAAWEAVEALNNVTYETALAAIEAIEALSDSSQSQPCDGGDK